jgi:hypothetical protein
LRKALPDDIALPGEPFDSTDVYVKGHKHRPYMFVWNIGNRWIVAMEQGGIAQTKGGYTNFDGARTSACRAECGMVIIRAMRHVATRSVPLFGLAILSGLHAYAQNKTACDLVSKSDAEAILGVTLEAPKPSAPFRSLLDPDFTSGWPEQGCEFTNFTFNYSVPNRPKPPKIVNVRLEVRYSSMPKAHAVDEARKQVDTRTYDHPTDLPGLGDAAFWIGAPNNVTVFVFLGGTTRLMIGPSEIGLEQEKALAAKAVGALGKTTFTYGNQPSGLNKPVLGKPGPNASALDELKRALTAKADAGDAKAQFALGRLYQSGTVAPDGTAQHD